MGRCGRETVLFQNMNLGIFNMLFVFPHIKYLSNDNCKHVESIAAAFEMTVCTFFTIILLIINFALSMFFLNKSEMCVLNIACIG